MLFRPGYLASGSANATYAPRISSALRDQPLLRRRAEDHVLPPASFIDRRHSFQRRVHFRSHSTLPVSTSSARTLRSRVPVKISPPAVTTGPTFG